MPYKVFLVEDEIAAREGIRDNVNWQSAGFEFCGEAADGEIALPMIETVQPDVLITDIKMPFMDGLQLTKIIREHMPWIKVIILSGYDEFKYAQTAVKLGVTDYLLKPVSVQDLHQVLQKTVILLDQEKSDREYLKLLRNQVEDNLMLLREKFLLRLVLGGESSISAIEQSQQLGLDILAKYYLVILINIKSGDSAKPFDYATCQQVEKLIAGLTGSNFESLLTRKDMEELVMILKGGDPDQLEQEGMFLADLIQNEVETKIGCRLVISLGSPQQRLGDLHRSFTEALVKNNNAWAESDSSDLLKLDQSALLAFLEVGHPAEFDAFFNNYVRPLGEAALHSKPLKHYIIVDILLTAAQFVSNLGGNAEQIIPDLNASETWLSSIKTMERLRDETRRIFTAALAFRDSQVNNDRAAIIQQAKAYINIHFASSSLSLNDVAAHVNFSPNHFSAVFSAETGETFRDYLMHRRVEQAKKLLITTHIKCAEVAFQCGYNDPHYFSIIFRKNVGMTPQKFRKEANKKK